MIRLSTDDAGLQEAARLLRAGALVLYPTESYYGAAVAALDPAAVARLVQAKGRAADSPLPLILPDRGALSRVVARVPPAARALMDQHWPGPLTLVLSAHQGLAPALVGPRGVGVRLSPHPVAAGLARRLGAPLTATSANRAGEPPPRTVAEAEAALPAAAAVLDGGATPGGPASTVLAVAADGHVTLLRAGAVHV
jgi:L-threonylcarbamoyladenylate synthase